MLASGFRYAIIGTVVFAFIAMAYILIEEIVQWRKSK